MLICRLSVLVLVFGSATGCALMMRGTSESFGVSSTPSNAEVKFSDGYSCTTPCIKEIKRSEGIQLTVTKEGCKAEHVPLKRKMEWPMLAANAGLYYGAISAAVLVAFVNLFDDDDSDQDLVDAIVYAGLFALPIDLMSGAMYSHTPNPLVVELDCEDSAQGESTANGE